MISNRCLRTAASIACACVLLDAGAAAAQNKKRPPRAPTTSPTSGTGGRSQLPVGSGTTLPAWLDDAETLDSKTASVELSVGRWSSIDGGETDGPAVDLAVGVTSWLQLGTTLPYYRAKYNDGYEASGLGDSYFSAKVQLLDPGDNRIGIAVQPLIEVLSKASMSDTTLGLSRTNWGLPITIQIGNDDVNTRAYATTGYFSRHAVFLGGAIERDLGSALTVAASVSFSHATQSSASSDLAGLSSSRTDASLLMYVSITPTITLFGDVGRTVSKLDQNGARLIASIGVRIETAHPAPRR